jgi:hypothetical protein
MIMIIFMTKGTVQDLFMCLAALSGSSQVGTTTPIWDETVFCKRVFEE